MSEAGRTGAPPSSGRKPRDDEIDVFALTHPGKVRAMNQDHFLVGSLRKQIEIHLTSLPIAGEPLVNAERVAFLAMVADGVGGGARGEEASRFALEAVMQYLTDGMHCYYTADARDEAAFTQALEEAALTCHARLAALAEEDPERRGMATTLTLWMGVWPWVYLLQVGDSRAYVWRDEALTQITRDQTMAQDLVDQGVLTRTDAFNTQWANVLSSSIGGHQTAPVVTRIRSDWRNVYLLCSDGLTKHVPDERIAAHLASMTSAKQVCEDLLAEAIDGGGSDNITVIVGRAVPKEPAGGERPRAASRPDAS